MERLLSMTGADWVEDFVLLRAEVARRGLGTVQVVVNDAMGARRTGSPDGDGVVVNRGTGAAIGARGPDGREWHTSHWQGVGGSLYLGQRTLTVVYRAPTSALQPLPRCRAGLPARRE